jgi:MFS family permease
LVRRLSRAVQGVRDAVLLVFSVVISSSTYGKWTNEPVFLVIFPIGVILLVLTVVDIILLVGKLKRRSFFYANSIAQLPILLLFAGLLGVVGLVLFLLDAAVLVTLREKKSPEEILKHPPVPITRNYRAVVGVGLLLVLFSMLMPWITTTNPTFSILAIYVSIATHSGLPALSIEPARVLFALLALFLPPVSLICGGLGLIRRRLSLVSGTLGILAGGSMIVVTTASSGPGVYVSILGGAMILVGYFAFKTAHANEASSRLATH